MLGKSTFQPKGFLEIWKVYDDGTEELHWSDHNIITEGMGIGLAHLYGGFGSSKITDFQIGYFQVGTGDATEYTSLQKELETPLGKKSDYGVVTNTYPEIEIDWAEVEDLTLRLNGVDLKPGTQPFGRIRHSNTHRVNRNAVRYTIPLNEKNCNSKNLSEIGLFMKNIKGQAEDQPLLVAYRQFPAIQKTEFFTLVFLWTIQF
jgi:hypothetical protein